MKKPAIVLAVVAVVAVVAIAVLLMVRSADQSPMATNDKTRDVGRPSDSFDNLTGKGSGSGGGVDAGQQGQQGPQRGDLQFLDGELEIAAGAIDKDVVRRVVKDNTTKLQYCYEKTLLANPRIEGKVIATFTIAAEGHVSDVKATGVHPDVEACVAETVRAFKFPPSATKVAVSYPFNFKPA